MKPTTTAMKIRERDIERACSDVLMLDGWRMLKTDPCSDRLRGKGFGEKGMADCLYIRYSMSNRRPEPWDQKTNCPLLSPAEAVWIEWKAPQGRVSLLQKVWHAQERARGALTLIAGVDFPATFDGFMAWYRGSGLQQKRM